MSVATHAHVRGGAESAAHPRGIREIVNKYPYVAAVLGVAMIAIFMYTATKPVPGPQVYYSYSDEAGNAFFTGELQAVPFEKDGREVVRAMVYSADGGPPFIAYLLRYKPEGKAKAEQAIKSHVAINIDEFEVRRPADKEWVSKPDPATAAKARVFNRRDKFAEVMAVKPPSGQKAVKLTMLMPE